MLTKAQASTMFALQASMNTKIDPNWVKSRYPYLLAVVIEGAEAIEHHGWKWWKKQDKDLAQLQMELIDIWHFMLSEMLLRNKADEACAVAQLLAELSISQDTLSFDGQTVDLTKLELLEKIELLIGLSAARRIEVALFASIIADCQLDWNSLFAQYVGKNVLNMFRQDHGYKEGSYLKEWVGREDNEHLVEVLASLDPSLPDFKDILYIELKTRYPA
jgi:dimeric dUTPase (all-alpha-NTP-PPase superfamily)